MQRQTDKTIIMYQAFGIPEAYNQVIFSLLSLYHVVNGEPGNLQPLVYTDNEEIFRKYFPESFLTVLPLSESDKKAYFGEINYLHRLKHCILKDCFERFRRNILFIDGDTFFLKPPFELAGEISEKQSIMHIREFDMQEAGEYEGLLWLRIRKLIRENTFYKKGEAYKIPYATVMWNVGVLGISYENRSVIDDTIELMDQMYPKGRIFNTEQLAAGYFIQNRTEIKPADDVVFHYWPADLKQSYNEFIRKFLAQHKGLSLPQLAAKAFEASKQKENLPRIEPSLWQRLKLRASLVKTVALKGSL